MHDGLALRGRGSVAGELQLQHLRQGLRLLAHLVRLVLPDDAAPPFADVVENPRVNLVIQPIDVLRVTPPCIHYTRRVVAYGVLPLLVRPPRHIDNVDEHVRMTQVIQELGVTTLERKHLVSQTRSLARSRNQSSDVEQLHRNLALSVLAETINGGALGGAMPFHARTLG